MKIIKVFLLLTCFSPLTAWSSIVVYASPSSSYLTVGETFTVDIYAHLPSPVIGWRMGFHFSEDILSQVGSPIIGPDWHATTPIHPSGIGGLAFPTAISGNVLLATLAFETFGTETGYIGTSHDPTNPLSGFPLLSPAGTFQDATHFPATVTVPSSSPLLLVALPLLLITAFRRYLARSYTR